jgi:hypothetical protein
MSLLREDCIHPFDTGFIPKISDDRDAIIVTHSSPLISAVSRVRVGEYRITTPEVDDFWGYAITLPTRRPVVWPKFCETPANRYESCPNPALIDREPRRIRGSAWNSTLECPPGSARRRSLRCRSVRSAWRSDRYP